jgi:hypothetical protein
VPTCRPLAIAGPLELRMKGPGEDDTGKKSLPTSFQQLEIAMGTHDLIPDGYLLHRVYM